MNAVCNAESAPIVLIGAVASGKSTIARLLSNELSCRVFSFGAYVRNQAKRQGIPLDRGELERFGSSLIAVRGYDNFLHDILETHVTTDPFILEGVRHVNMLEAVKRRYPSVVSIYLDVPTDLRYERWRVREGFADGTACRALFDDIAQGEVERYVYALMNVADHIVYAARPTRLIAAEILSFADGTPELAAALIYEAYDRDGADVPCGPIKRSLMLCTFGIEDIDGTLEGSLSSPGKRATRYRRTNSPRWLTVRIRTVADLPSANDLVPPSPACRAFEPGPGLSG